MKVTGIKTTSKQYNAVTGGDISILPKFIQDNFTISRYIVITDENVLHHHKKELYNLFGKKNILPLKPGEKSKSFAAVNDILSFLAENNFGRDSLIIAIGGGVTGDLAGFIASIYMRGIKLIHVPTTLLAAVDSSIGGKTGINYLNRKNIIGSFYQPDLVLVDTHFLNTLPEEEIISGTGEVIKYAFLSDAGFFSHIKESYSSLLKLDKDITDEIIYNCIRIKASYVEMDETEANTRQVLNLGHTFGHAIESASSFKIPHGEGVALGIIASLYLSYYLNLFDENRLQYFLSLPLMFPFSGKIRKLKSKEIMEFLKYDKKNREGKNKFVLVKEAGNVLTGVEADKALVQKSLGNLFK